MFMERRSLRRFSIVSALALALLAIASYGVMDHTAAQDEPVVVINELNGSGVSGDATLTDNGDGTTTVDILVDGATGGHPAHIHSGTCDALGDVVYPLTDVDATGASLTDVDTTVADLQAAPHAINIHLSADEIGTYVACGDITAGVGAETTAAQTAATPAAQAQAQASPTGVGGTESVTDIGSSGVGTTSSSSTGFLALAIGAAALMVLAGAFSMRRKGSRG
jgi:hypothetical protein